MDLLGKFIKSAIRKEIRKRTRSLTRPATGKRKTSTRPLQLPPTWIPPGYVQRIQGFDVLDGMFYIGTASTRNDPCLVDPDLEIDVGASASTSRGTTYRTFSPRKRAQYLDWLSSGRRLESAPPEFIRFFLTGLERYALVELRAESIWQRELDAIVSEARGLLKTYGTDRTLHRQLSAFIDCLDFRKKASLPNAKLPPPKLTRDRGTVPGYVKLELAEIAVSEKPMPSDRALAWAWFLPDTTITSTITAAHRYFVLLFLLRYEQRWPQGIPVPSGTTLVSITYKPVHTRVADFSLRHPALKDVFSLPQPASQLSALVAEVSEELERWSRWLKRNADRKNDLEGLALLPWELLSTAPGNIEPLQQWLEPEFAKSPQLRTSITPVLDLWEKGTEKLTRKQARELAQLLAHIGVGIEPDPRFGDANWKRDDPVVLFRVTEPMPATPTEEFTAALVLAGAAMAVCTPADLNLAIEYTLKTVALSPVEQTRIRAHMTWLSTADVKLSSLKTSAESLPNPVREMFGNVAVMLAVSDGSPTPADIRTLTSIFRVLQLDPEQVTHRTFRAVSSGLEIAPVSWSQTPSTPTTSTEFTLDATSIQQKLAETAAVNALLGDIFDEEEDGEPEPEPAPTPANESLIASLDASHSALVRELITKPEWTRAAFEQIAATHNLLPNGAIATINEVAYELANEPLLDGEDPLTLNTYALEAFPL